MPITELSRDEYQGTMEAPMRRLGPDEVSGLVPIGGYLAECLQAYQLPASLDAVEIEHIYLSKNQIFVHVVLAYGEKHQRLVIVVNQQLQTIYGHYRLDLAAEYGLNKD